MVLPYLLHDFFVYSAIILLLFSFFYYVLITFLLIKGSIENHLSTPQRYGLVCIHHTLPQLYVWDCTEYVVVDCNLTLKEKLLYISNRNDHSLVFARKFTQDDCHLFTYYIYCASCI